MSSIEQRIREANGRLRANYVGFTIQQIGGRLWIRGILPPKPGSNQIKPFQQRLSIANANQEGVKIAEKMAKRISIQLDAKTFEWGDYLNLAEPETTKTIGDWVKEFETDYFNRRTRTFKTETTWKVEYSSIFKFLPQDEPLTIQTLEKIISSSKPDTRIRKRYCQTLTMLANFAGLDCDFHRLQGTYTHKSRIPRDIPTDRQIQDFYFEINNPGWRWIYGMIATYGLRNHEAFFVDLHNSWMGNLSIFVTQGKTGARQVWPLHPEWVDTFDLLSPNSPLVSLDRANRDIGFTVTRYLSRTAKMPFHVYDLRHAWAVRSLEYGIDISLAAKQMGHSLQVHSNLYHTWIDSKIHQRAFEAAINKSDRPLPPKID